MAKFKYGNKKICSNTSLEPDPFREVLADRTLQEVVDKIFPWMKTKEDQEEKEFYARRGIELKPEYAEDVNSPDKKKKFGLETRAAVMANKNECPSSLTSPIQVRLTSWHEFCYYHCIPQISMLCHYISFP